MSDDAPVNSEQELLVTFRTAAAAYQTAQRHADQARKAEFYARCHFNQARVAYYAHPAVIARHEADTTRDLSSAKISPA